MLMNTRLASLLVAGVRLACKTRFNASTVSGQSGHRLRILVLLRGNAAQPPAKSRLSMATFTQSVFP
jgi:hypothetical protein